MFDNLWLLFIYNLNMEKKINLTFYSLVYKKSNGQIIKLVETLIDCYEHNLADFIISYSDKKQFDTIINSYVNYSDKFIYEPNPDEYPRNIRLLKDIDLIKTNKIMIVDGDDYISKNLLSLVINSINNSKDFIVFRGDRLEDHNGNLAFENTNIGKRSVDGFWVQTYIFSKELFIEASNHDAWKYVACNSISDVILGMLLYALVEEYEIKYINSNSPYIYRPKSETSLNAKESTWSWGEFYSNNPYCSDKLMGCKIRNFTEALEAMKDDLSKTNVSANWKVLAEQQILVDKNRNK